MKLARCFPLLVLLGGTVLHANPLTGLTDTGATSTGTVISTGSSDPSWSVTGPGNSGATDATVGNLAGGSWVGNDSSSQWIYDSVGNADAGYFDFTTTFTATTPGSDSISGLYAVDNSLVNVFLNGVALNISNSGGVANGNTNGYASFATFSIPTGSDFLTGTNTLMFETYNGGGPSGLRVEFNAVPDTYSTAGLLGLGILLLGLNHKRLRAKRIA